MLSTRWDQRLNCNRQFAEGISIENELYRLEIYVIEGTCVKKPH